MYGTPIVFRCKAVTPWAGATGEDGNKHHGLTLTGDVTVTDPEFFTDIGYGKAGEYINLVLNGELPVHAPYSLAFSQRELILAVSEPVECKVQVPCELVYIETSAYRIDHFDVRLKLKTRGKLTDAVSGKLVKLNGELVHMQLECPQKEMFDDPVFIVIKQQQDNETAAATTTITETEEEAVARPSKKKRSKKV